MKFERLVREIAQDVTMSDLLFEKAAIVALQEAAEAKMVELLKKAGQLATHAKRVTIMPNDIKFAVENDWFNSPDKSFVIRTSTIFSIALEAYNWMYLCYYIFIYLSI